MTGYSRASSIQLHYPGAQQRAGGRIWPEHPSSNGVSAVIQPWANCDQNEAVRGFQGMTVQQMLEAHYIQIQREMAQLKQQLGNSLALHPRLSY